MVLRFFISLIDWPGSGLGVGTARTSMRPWVQRVWYTSSMVMEVALLMSAQTPAVTICGCRDNERPTFKCRVVRGGMKTTHDR